MSAFHRQRAAERFSGRRSWRDATEKRRAYPTRVWRMHEHHCIPLLNHTACCYFCGHEMRLRIGSDRKGETLNREFSERNTLNAFLRNTNSVERNVDFPGFFDYFTHVPLYGLLVKCVELGRLDSSSTGQDFASYSIKLFYCAASQKNLRTFPGKGFSYKMFLFYSKTILLSLFYLTGSSGLYPWLS